MVQIDAHLSTGLPGLDRMLKGLIPGDNIVWQVDAVENYNLFVAPFCQSAAVRGKRLTYFRFAKHAPLIPPGVDAEIYQLHPEESFENFIIEIHRVIEANGRGGYYVFDCLTDLAVDWYSDQMLGNFFMLTCPYLLDVEAIAYFALLRNSHSFHATTPIFETTQVFLDVYRYRDRIYLQPLKVQRRYSPTMYMLHHWAGEDFAPVTVSATIAEILTSVPQLRLETSSYRLGIWNRSFMQAEEMLSDADMDEISIQTADKIFHRLLRMIVSRDERVLTLAEKFLTIADLCEIGKRMIGTGLIGGKSVGMLLARAILEARGPALDETCSKSHDSFYIGSDVFYTFPGSQRHAGWVRQKQREPERLSWKAPRRDASAS